MDANRFDALARTLTAVSSRRGAGRALAGLTLGGMLIPLSGLTETKARKKKRKGKGKKKKGGKPSPPAAFCADHANGASCDDSPCKACQDGACVPSTDDALCNGTGRCLNGVCNPPPSCLQPGNLDCFPDTPAVCCSGVCDLVFNGVGTCVAGGAGTDCFANGDCTSNRCTGFICQ
jgi:hypothetical protein